MYLLPDYVCAVTEVHVSPRSPEREDELSGNDYSRSLLHGCSEDLTLSLHAYSHTHTQLLEVVRLLFSQLQRGLGLLPVWPVQQQPKARWARHGTVRLQDTLLNTHTGVHVKQV